MINCPASSKIWSKQQQGCNCCCTAGSLVTLGADIVLKEETGVDLSHLDFVQLGYIYNIYVYGKWSKANVYVFSTTTMPEGRVVDPAEINKLQWLATDPPLMSFRLSQSMKLATQLKLQRHVKLQIKAINSVNCKVWLPCACQSKTSFLKRLPQGMISMMNGVVNHMKKCKVGQW